MTTKRFILASIVATASIIVLAAPTPAPAADKIRAAKAIDVLWIYTSLDIGVEAGIFAKYGLDVEVSVMSGGAKLHQALVANSIDVGLDGATGMALAVKGATDIGIAAYAGALRNYSINVAVDSPIKTVADMKGKLFGVASNGSLPEWVTKRVSIAEGWGPNGIRTTATGGFEATLAATLNHTIDGFIGATEAGLLLEERGKGRIVGGVEHYVPRFVSQAVFARQELIKQNPDLVARFLKGLFATVAFMKANKEKTTEIATRVLHQTPTVMSKTHDLEIAMLSDNGVFDPEAMKVLKDSYIEMGILPERPRDDQLFDARFLPVKP